LLKYHIKSLKEDHSDETQLDKIVEEMIEGEYVHNEEKQKIRLVDIDKKI
jgi:hypothetical protein